MPFCEECGAKLALGVRFCEECGAPVAGDGERGPIPAIPAGGASALDVFSGDDWQAQWREFVNGARGLETGIVLTRQAALLSQVDLDENGFLEILSDYIDNRRERGVAYAYLDLEAFRGGCGASATAIVKALRDIFQVKKPKYLFILGNEDVAGVVRWENIADDGDPDVPADLCYATLDTNSPWNGQTYDFDETVRAGRLPTYPGESTADFSSYFKSAMQFSGRLGPVRAYGLSALAWEAESNDEYGAVSGGSVDVSPDVATDDVGSRIDPETNLLFFNLHGSDGDAFWYGQDAGDYPRAFSPDVLAGRDGGYVLGVEACYGAKFVGGLGPDDSILMTALQNGCLAFLGSTRIAYGTSEPDGCCADLVAGEFVKRLAEGQSAGDAHAAGLKRLLDKDHPDDTDIKTLAEFALYGDPSVRMSADIAPMTSFRSAPLAEGGGIGLHVPIPDVRRAVTMALVRVNARIDGLIDDFVVRELLPDIGPVGIHSARQKTFRMRNSGLNQKIYSLKRGPVRIVAKVYFDDEGRVHKAVISK